MLVRFAVENFLSFKELAEFNMTAGKITRHRNHIALCNDKRILKGAYIFGANAGGKTNFIRAISFAKRIITDGLDSTNCEKKYFRIESEYRNKPSTFQFDIYSGGHFYSYGFAISLINRVIEEEWLYQIDDQDKCIFLRTKLDDGSYSFLTDLRFATQKQKDRFNFYAEDICNIKMERALFLSDIIQRSPDTESEYQSFRDVMAWFNRLIIIFPDSKYGGIIQLVENDNERIRLENLLNYFDTGICQVVKNAQEFDKAFTMFPEKILESLKADLAKDLTNDVESAHILGDGSRIEVKYDHGDLVALKVLANHGNDDELFEYSEESDGTQRLFDLIPVFQKVLNNSVILIDELDRSLHTKAVLEFINYYYSIASSSASQLIVTTHDSNIMDLDYVRQDEIWFIERQTDHSSKLYSLNQFRARFDKKVEKEYLLGRYGAIPMFRQSAFELQFVEGGDSDGGTHQ